MQTLKSFFGASLGLFFALGCLGRPVSAPEARLQSGVHLSISNRSIDQVDILFEIDNSASMLENQAQLAAQFRVLIDQLVSPPVIPSTGRPRYPPVRSLHVGVISSDLGTPGSTAFSSCSNSDLGDDGLLNPIRQGQAMRNHQPWAAGPSGIRPSRCTTNRDQYPTFLTFTANHSDPEVFREDFVCNAFLSSTGCGLEQQLESAYRALVVHNPREQAGNTDPNAGFVRDHAVLAIVIVSDEEDGSTRDCRFAERDAQGRSMPCQDALGVFDYTSTEWASSEMNLRFYMYQPGSGQDPTWPLERYIDPARPTRGFLSLKPGRPDHVIFAAIAGVPIELPVRGGTVDWDALLGTDPSGSGGYTGMSPEGRVSMRQRNLDPACPTRVVPACRREGTRDDPARPACTTAEQYHAWPSRRLAEVARRFDQSYGTGTLSSICRSSYAEALDQIVRRIGIGIEGACFPRSLGAERAVCCDPNNLPRGCAQAPGCAAPNAVAVRCEVRETLSPGANARSWCVPAHGRRFIGRENGRDVCSVDQIAVLPGGTPALGAHGYFYDLRPDPSCRQRISFTEGDSVPNGADAVIDCVQLLSGGAQSPSE